jgi:pre-mRNA-splicing factor ISY1
MRGLLDVLCSSIERCVGALWWQVVVMRSETDDMVDSDLEDEVDEDEEERQPKRFEFVAHVPLPDEKEIERMVVEKKKQELLSKYASEDLVKEEQEAKEMLNIHR